MILISHSFSQGGSSDDEDDGHSSFPQQGGGAGVYGGGASNGLSKAEIERQRVHNKRDRGNQARERMFAEQNKQKLSDAEYWARVNQR